MVTVTADGSGVVSHVGSRLLADVAQAAGLAGRMSATVVDRRAERGEHRRRGGHDAGRVLVDLAVMLADGGEAISDLAVLRQQPAVFGSVASTSTAWRVLDEIDDLALAGLATARAAARERAWMVAAEAGRDVPPARAGGREVRRGGPDGQVELVIDLDATIVVTHSDKEAAAATFKGTYGYHPVLAFLDNTGEALAGVLRPGNAGANTAADLIAVTDAAIAQLPDAHRYGTAILIRSDGAGGTKAWLGHLDGLRDNTCGRGLQVEFSVGFRMSQAVQDAILALPEHAWFPAIEADGSLREGAEVAEVTGMLPAAALDGWPPGMRVIARRERPHPGAQLRFSDIHGHRFQAFATNTTGGQLAHLEARHRAHARVEDRIRCAKDTGLGRLPSRQFAINAAWLTLAMTAIDLISWTQWALLDGDLQAAEPKALRYRLLHVAARLTRGQRRVWIRVQRTWPWARDLAGAFSRLHMLVPAPLRT